MGGLFKTAAFAREVLIASRFGLSAVTDTYFAFQQLPLTVAAFMFGPFILAFTPVYADEKRRCGRVNWLPGLLVYGCLLGLVITAFMILLSPWLLGLVTTPTADARSTLAILSWAFIPAICLGIWAGVALADGRNLFSAFVMGLPYLSMTLLLLGLYWIGRLNNLSLPISFLFGFGALGVYAIVHLAVAECGNVNLRMILATPSLPGFRAFLRQLGASSLENVGFTANQLLLVYFVAQTGTGAVSAYTCAMRLGMLGFTLLGQPLAQLVQAKLCAAVESERLPIFRKWLAAVGCLVVVFAIGMVAFRSPLVKLVYLHGRFSGTDFARVTAIMPAWTGYFVVASLNGLASRYLFTSTQGSKYVRRLLAAYALANLARLVMWGRLGSAAVVWCSVAAEGCALLLNLRNCLEKPGAPLDLPVNDSSAASLLGAGVPANHD